MGNTCLTLSRRAALRDLALFDRRDFLAVVKIYEAVHILLCNL